MNDVNGVSSLASSATLREFANQPFRRSDSSNSAVLDDTVEISDLAAFLSRLSELPEDRARRIVSIRNAILDGSYVTDEKLDIATDRLIDELNNEESPLARRRVQIA